MCQLSIQSKLFWPTGGWMKDLWESTVDLACFTFTRCKSLLESVEFWVRDNPRGLFVMFLEPTCSFCSVEGFSCPATGDCAYSLAMLRWVAHIKAAWIWMPGPESGTGTRLSFILFTLQWCCGVSAHARCFPLSMILMGLPLVQPISISPALYVHL